MNTKKFIISTIILVLVTMLGITSCSPGDVKVFEGILKQVDGISGNVTVTMKDGTSVTFNLDDIELNTDGGALKPGDNITVEKDKRGKVKKVKVCYAEIQGTITGIVDENVTVATTKKGDVTIQVTEKTVIMMAEKNRAGLDDLAVGQKVTAKYEISTQQAVKIIVHLEKKEAEIQGTIKSIDGDNVTITTAKAGDITVVVTADTRIMTTSNNNAGIADLEVGQKVTARYEINTGQAIKIIVQKPVIKYAEIQGTIKDIVDEDVTITVVKKGDITVHVTPETKIIIGDSGNATVEDLSIGQTVNAKYETNTMNAVKIIVKIVKPVIKYAEIQGTIKDIAGEDVTITVEKKGDITVHVTPETMIIIGDSSDAALEDLSVGQVVHAKYETGSMNAVKIIVKVVKPVVKYAEIQGTIKDIVDEDVTITVVKKGDITVHVTPETKIIIGDSGNATVEDLSIGQNVNAKYETNTMNAVKIIVKIEKVLHVIQGVVQAVDAGDMTVTIAIDDTEFLVLNITPETLIKIVDVGVGDFSDVDVGQKVEAKYYADTMDAVKIYIYIEED